MSVQKRPTAVTVIAVLNFVIGGLGLLGLLCGGLGMLLLGSLVSNMPAPPQGQPNPLKEMMAFYESVPGYIPFMIVSAVLGGIMAVVLIVAGIGLLRMRGWARMACFVYAVYAILSSLGGAAYNFAVVLPATEKWMAEFQKKIQPKGAAAPAGPGASINTISGAAGTIAGTIYGIAYALVLLIVLNLRDVRAAFARAAAGGIDTDEEAARAWQHEEPPDILDEGRGRLGGDQGIKGPDQW
jgi:hypothetical protein